MDEVNTVPSLYIEFQLHLCQISVVQYLRQLI